MRTKVGGESSYRGGESQSHVGSDDVFIVEQEDAGSRNGSGNRRENLETTSPSQEQKQNTAKSQKPGPTHYPGGSTHSSSDPTSSYRLVRSMAEPDSRKQCTEWNDQCLGLESETSVPTPEKEGEGLGEIGTRTWSKQKEVQTLSGDEDTEEGLSPLQMVSVGLGASTTGGSKEQSQAQRQSSERTDLSDPVDVIEVVRDVESHSSCEYVCTTSEYFEPRGASSGSRGRTPIPQHHGPEGRASSEAVLDDEDEFKLELEREGTTSPVPVSEDKAGKEQSFEGHAELSCMESEAPDPPDSVPKDHLKPESTLGSATPSDLTASQLLSPDSEIVLKGFKKTCETFDESSQRKFVAPPTSPPPLIHTSDSAAYSSRLRRSAGRTASDTGLDDQQSNAGEVGAKPDGQRRAVRLRGADTRHSTSASSGSTSAGSIEVEFDFEETLQRGKGPFNPFAFKRAPKMRPSLVVHPSKGPAKVRRVDRY